jgi:hypothetical protein
MAAGVAAGAAAVELLELLEALEPPRSHGKHAPVGKGVPPVNGMKASPVSGALPRRECPPPTARCPP